MQNLLSIAGLFAGNGEWSTLSITKKSNTYSLKVNDSSYAQDRMSRIYFNEIVGSERIEKICNKHKLDKLSPLTKDYIRKIFVGLFDIDKSDLYQTELTYDALVSMGGIADFETLLMGCGPTSDYFTIDKAKTSGKGFNGLIERVYLSLQHHFKVIAETNQKAAEIRDIEMLTSRMADREMQLDSVVHLHDGYFYVDRIFVSDGAYVSILKDIDNKATPKLVCRGTAFRRTATQGFSSGLNDLNFEIGSLGVKGIWNDLSAYLKTTQPGAIEIMGKSLGGAHAQALAVLIEGLSNIQIKKLVTYCSVGIGENISNLFKREIIANRHEPFQIQVIRNGSPRDEEVDYIPMVGGEHLGAGAPASKCQVEVIYIQPEDQNVGILPTQDISLLTLSKNFTLSFSGPHCRQTTLDKFTWTILNNPVTIEEHLNTGKTLEGIRQRVATVFDFMSFRYFNRDPFVLFYEQEKKKILANS